MEMYLLKSSCIALLLYLFYTLVLEKTSVHKFKRGYLLFSLLAALCIPFINMYEEVIIVPATAIEPIATSEAPLDNLVGTDVETTDFSAILFNIYIIGLILFGSLFARNLFLMIKKVLVNIRLKSNDTTKVLLTESILPHTFFRYIFLNKVDYENNSIPESVMLHEKTHAKEKHSLDVLIVEFLQVLFWFNPLIYLYKKAIKLNHEFLADQAVLDQGVSVKTYQETLLAFSSNDYQYQLANAINYSLIKKRFNSMKTQTSRRAVWIKSLLLLPLLAILLFSFGNTVTTYQNESETTNISEDVLEVIIEGENTFKIDNKTYTLNELKDKLKSLNQDQITMRSDGMIRYEWVEMMIKELRASNINCLDFRAEIIEMDENKYEDNIPLSESVTRLQGNTLIKTQSPKRLKFPIVNGANCMNCVLSMSSNQLKNVVLESSTKEKVESFKIKFYKHPTVVLKGNKLAEPALKYLKNAKIGEDVAIFDITTKSGPLDNWIKVNLVSEIQEKANKELTVKQEQKGASKEQITKYNKLASYYNKMLKKDSGVRIKMTDVEQLKYIYNLMTEKQRAKAEPFPNFPPPPPPPPAPESPKNIKELKAPKPPKVAKRANENIPPPPPPPPAPKKGKKVEIPEPPAPPAPPEPVKEDRKNNYTMYRYNAKLETPSTVKRDTKINLSSYKVKED